MKVFAGGSGPPLVVVPGIQGRWEWLRPALDALRTRCRAATYSLCGDLMSGATIDASRGFDRYLRQLDEVFERTNFASAAVCGISYGGFIALRYAATRPERVSHLILASAPAPGWKPDPRQARYIARPWLSTPAFIATAPSRLWPEIHAAHEGLSAGLSFCARHAIRVMAAPAKPALMAARIVEQQSLDFTSDCAAVRCPTLVVSGEPHLDAVVPVEATRRYLSLIPGAKYAMIERTGHLGLLTRPAVFASIVSEFIADAHG